MPKNKMLSKKEIDQRLNPNLLESYIEYRITNNRIVPVEVRDRSFYMASSELLCDSLENFLVMSINSPLKTRLSVTSADLDRDKPRRKPKTAYIATDGSMCTYHIKSSNGRLTKLVGYSAFALQIANKVKHLDIQYVPHAVDSIEVEYQAVLNALEYIKSSKSTRRNYVILTDQEYLVYTIATSNKPTQMTLTSVLFERIRNILDYLHTQGYSVSLQYTPSHSKDNLHNFVDKALKIKQTQYNFYLHSLLKNPDYKPLSPYRTKPNKDNRPTV